MATRILIREVAVARIRELRRLDGIFWASVNTRRAEASADALVNMHTEPQTAALTLRRSDLVFGNGKVRLRARYPTGVIPDGILDRRSLTFTIAL